MRIFFFFLRVKWDKSNARALNFDASNVQGPQGRPSALGKHQIQGKCFDLSHFLSKSNAN